MSNLSWRSGAGYDVIRAARERYLAVEIERIKSEDNAVQIDGYSSYYITPSGDVYTTSGRKLSKLRPGRKGSGYRFVGLNSDDGERKYEMIHRLVAKAFIDNPLNLPAVNHIDLNKSNNRVENLEWVTYSENTMHAIENGAFVVGVGARSLSPDDIDDVRCATGSYRDIGRRFGCSAQTVCNIKRGHSSWKRKTSFGLYNDFKSEIGIGK
jgi:hypothetical protein